MDCAFLEGEGDLFIVLHLPCLTQKIAIGEAVASDTKPLPPRLPVAKGPAGAEDVLDCEKARSIDDLQCDVAWKPGGFCGCRLPVTLYTAAASP